MTEKQFRKIVLDYEKLVFTVCYQLVRDYQEAENLTQETFITAYFHIDKCSPDKYKPYITRIAANKAKDYLKSAYKKHETSSYEFQAEQIDRASPELITVQRENTDELINLIASLKEPYKTISHMYFLDECSPSEISEALNKPLKTVQTQILRSKKTLQKSIKEANHYG